MFYDDYAIKDYLQISIELTYITFAKGQKAFVLRKFPMYQTNDSFVDKAHTSSIRKPKAKNDVSTLQLVNSCQMRAKIT